MDCDQKGGGRVKQIMLVLLFLSSALLIGLTPVVLEFPSVDATYSYFEEYFALLDPDIEFKDLRFLGMNSLDSLLFLGSNSLPTFVSPIGIQGFSIEADLKGELETLLRNTELKVSTGNVFTIKNNHTPAYVWFNYSSTGMGRWILLSLFLVENGLAEYEECRVLREDIDTLLSEASSKAQENLTGQWKVVISSKPEGKDTSKSSGSTFIYSPAGSSEVFTYNGEVDIFKVIMESEKPDEIEKNNDQQTVNDVKRAEDIEKMREFSGEGLIEILVRHVISKSPSSGYYWLYVWTIVRNLSDITVHANPTYFTLICENRVYNPHINTYSLKEYFDAVDLYPITYTAGWLLFYVPKASSYTIVYDWFLGKPISKKIVITEKR